MMTTGQFSQDFVNEREQAQHNSLAKPIELVNYFIIYNSVVQ